jgi:hypothetical protein
MLANTVAVSQYHIAELDKWQARQKTKRKQPTRSNKKIVQ